MMSNKLNGYYIVNNKKFDNKLQAVIEASKNKSKLEWIYFDDIFSSATLKFNKHNILLTDLYRERAQQLRDSYNYLILNYSGGSDSHNILMTFLKNKIKLDHIYVQWPVNLVDKNLYVPNSKNKSNENFHSEWDLVLKKDLEWLGQNYPEIKIEIADWSNSVKESFYTDHIFANDVNNLPSIARSQKQNTFSLIETKLSLQGKTVANIFGIDKPCVVKKDNQWFFCFADTACMAQPNPNNPYGTEYFYWSPNFPDISIAQAHAMKNFYENNPHLIILVEAVSERIKKDPLFLSKKWQDFHYPEFALRQEYAKLVCYPHWDFNRFQADKPFSILSGFKMGLRAWDNILTAIPNFDRIQKNWEYLWKSYLTQIDPLFMRNQDTFKVFLTRWHCISKE